MTHAMTHTSGDTRTVQEPRTVAEAATLASIYSAMVVKARRLFVDGYRMEAADGPFEGLYFVHTPAGKFYVVDPEHGRCTCPAFEHFGICKHVICVRGELEQADAMLAEFNEHERGRNEWESDALEHAMAAGGCRL